MTLLIATGECHTELFLRCKDEVAAAEVDTRLEKLSVLWFCSGVAFWFGRGSTSREAPKLSRPRFRCPDLTHSHLVFDGENNKSYGRGQLVGFMVYPLGPSFVSTDRGFYIDRLPYRYAEPDIASYTSSTFLVETLISHGDVSTSLPGLADHVTWRGPLWPEPPC